MIYPDLQFISSVLVKGEFSAPASALLREIPHPLCLSIVHRLQIENSLLRLAQAPKQPEAPVAMTGLRMWRAYLVEEVFTIRGFDLDAAFSKAAAWNAGASAQPPRWGLLLHAAIAAGSRSTFLSFDRDLRQLASADGLTVLPESL